MLQYRDALQTYVDSMSEETFPNRILDQTKLDRILAYAPAIEKAIHQAGMFNEVSYTFDCTTDGALMLEFQAPTLDARVGPGSTFVNLLRSCDGMSVESKEATDDDEEDQVILWLYFRNIWRCG